MFYSQFILAKKGPLGTIWIAAHLERKLRKNQVADTDIGVSVDSILSPDVPIALRLSSHLLLGVVRIYSRKVNYLFDDCSEALLKVKQAFRSTVVDLPPEESKAPYHSITLPETFDLDDFELPDTAVFQGNFVDHHVSAKEQITLQDTMDSVVFSASQYGLDERFGDGDASQIALDLDEELLLNKGSSGHGVLLTSRADPQTRFEPSSSQKGDQFDEEMLDTCQDIDTNCNIEVGSSLAQHMELNLSSNGVHISATDEVSDPLKDPNPEFGQNGGLGKSEVNGGLDVTGERGEGKVTGLNETNVSLNSSGKPASLSEEADCQHDKSTVNGFCSISDNPSFVDQSSIEHAVGAEGMLDINSTPENKEAQIRPGASEVANEDVKADMLSVCKPLLQPCNKSNNQENAELENLVSTSKDCGIGSEEIPGMQDAPGVSVANVQDCSIHVEDKLDNNSNVENKRHDLMIQETPKVATVDGDTDTFTNHQEKAELHNTAYRPKDGLAGSEEISGIQGAPEVAVAEVQDVRNQNLNEDHFLVADPCNNLAGQPVILETIQSQKGSDSVAPELPSPEKMLSLPDLPVTQSNDLLLETTPQREVLAQSDQDATMTKISGKKRSFTESTITLQSQNSVDTSEAAQSRRTVDSVPDDDDLLSSILVGRRSTVLKVKSTPAVDLVSSKRPRVTPRSGAQKRKVLVDDSMVLHGDTIRQQLVNTEDIRRVRKKAPSTCPEIWILQKHFLEDEMFHEPIFTGLSSKLISLHCQPFDLSQTKLVEDDRSNDQSSANGMTLSPKRPATGEGAEFEEINVPSIAIDDYAQQSAECPSNTPVEHDMRVSSELFGSTVQNETITNSEVIHTPLYFDISENRTEMETDCSTKPNEDEVMTNSEFGRTLSQSDIMKNRTEMETECRSEPNNDERDHSVTFGIESSSGLPCASENNGNLVNGEIVQSTCIKDLNADFFEQVDGLCMKLDEQSNGKEDILSVEAACGEIVEQRPEEPNLEIRLENTDLVVPAAGAQTECSLPVDTEAIFAEGKADDGNTYELGIVNNAEFHESDLKCDEKRDDSKCDPSDPGGDLYDHDTDFLNFDDDDEIAEDDENSNPNAGGTQILDNTGWSTRTRAVSNYLQVLFHKEAQHGRTVLRLDNLLANKSRKEASRMFFETLVLKTRDYIHVDQEIPFDNINIKPRARLLKSEF